MLNVLFVNYLILVVGVTSLRLGKDVHELASGEVNNQDIQVQGPVGASLLPTAIMESVQPANIDVLGSNVQVANGTVGSTVTQIGGLQTGLQTSALGDEGLNSSKNALATDSANGQVAGFVGPTNTNDLLSSPLSQKAHPHSTGPAKTQLESFDRPELGVAGILAALGSGTGIGIEEIFRNPANVDLQREILIRTKYQSQFIFYFNMMVFLGYLGMLGVAAKIAYHKIRNESAVTFYADPRFYSASMENTCYDDFVNSFAGSPKNVYLRVFGYVPVPDEEAPSHMHLVTWKGANYRIAFSFQLDVSPWVVRVQRRPMGPQAGGMPFVMREEVFSTEDLEKIAYHLRCDPNDLSIINVRKEVDWSGWEEIATNIKQRIKQRGFEGIVGVRMSEAEVMSVYKNKQWANFMHNSGTKAIAALSVVGFLPYLCYMWSKCLATDVRCNYKVDVAPDSFWSLIDNELGVAGFGSWGAQRNPVAVNDAGDIPPAQDVLLGVGGRAVM